MNRKNKIIVSVVGITIVVLALLGITYGYYLTRIQGNTNSNSISVTSADLKLTYADLTENIILDKAMPNTTVTKQFTVTNDGTVKINDYHIYLENVVNELSRKEDLVYTLTCTTNDEVNSPCTNEIENETTFPSTNGTILTNSIDKRDIHTYTLTLKYKEMNVDQSEDMGKIVSAKINLYDANALNTLTLGHYILENGAQVLNTTTNELSFDKTYTEKTTITKVADGTDMEDVGIFTAPDDYGTSYYYRGTVKNNYVNFAGFTWRIVRINGDGSVRLILEGTLDKVCVEYKVDGSCKKYGMGSASYNSDHNNNAQIGYMYGLELGNEEEIVDRCLVLENNVVTDKIVDENYSTKELCEINGGKWTTNSYEATHSNLISNTSKKKVDNFYEKYIESDTNNRHYEKYLADTLFCNDKGVADQSIGNENTGLAYGTNATYYKAAQRFLYSNGINVLKEMKPTLKCAEGEIYNYSRLTSNLDNATTLENGLSINNDLKHPIALITADEMAFAGAMTKKTNQQYYLFDAYKEGITSEWWYTMTPTSVYFHSSGILQVNVFRYSSNSESLHSYISHGATGTRPVINLKSNLLVESGDGTKNGPYTIKIIN